jgi:predicted dithiol-disulfide oxidoreductase (DUF899 family)
MTETQVARPNIASREEWLVARKALLAKEKELTQARDALAAERRRLPMVKIDKDYVFSGPSGQVSLLELFHGRRQLIVYHFMFAPEWKKGCAGCTGFVDALNPVDLAMLHDRDTSFTLVSRAPLERLERYRNERGWRWPWVSSFGSDFNYDFHATLDEDVAPIVYNYRTKGELEAGGAGHFTKGEAHGLSVFFRSGDEVFHTYSTYARGCEGLSDAYSLLDTTPYGRQEDWEDSPEGWPQRPTYG